MIHFDENKGGGNKKDVSKLRGGETGEKTIERGHFTFEEVGNLGQQRKKNMKKRERVGEQSNGTSICRGVHWEDDNQRGRRKISSEGVRNGGAVNKGPNNGEEGHFPMNLVKRANKKT